METEQPINIEESSQTSVEDINHHHSIAHALKEAGVDPDTIRNIVLGIDQ